MKINKIIIVAQVMFLLIVVGVLYYLYPKANVSVDNDFVEFSTINANVIMISENPDFSNPKYIDLESNKEIGFNLSPGTYYWKADNGVILGFSNKITIDSEVGMNIEKHGNETDLVNVGNVNINVSRTKDGSLVGNVILSPDESENITDSGEYMGRQDGK
jgi:hypothetical protein